MTEHSNHLCCITLAGGISCTVHQQYADRYFSHQVVTATRYCRLNCYSNDPYNSV